MARSNSDMDKIMDLFLYIFPKYLNKVNEQKNDRDIIKKIPLERPANKPILREIEKKDNKYGGSKEELAKNDHKLENIEKGKLVKENGTRNIPREHDIKADKENSIKHEDKNRSYIKEQEHGKESYEDSTTTNEFSREKKNNNIFKNEICSTCTDGMEKILKKLIGEKVDISITDSTMFLLNAATILYVDDTIVKLKTVINTTVIIPIHEIVGIRSNSIYGISFEDNDDLGVCIESCKREERLRRYFSSIIGKKVFLQTKGVGEFKYINNRIITGTGKGVVIIEGTIAISLCKIILIEEIV